MIWKVAESYPAEELFEMGQSPDSLKTKWENVADDMALIPERNVRVVLEKGIVRVEVSDDLYDCMRGV
ncbi:MAG: hypothetical protein KKC99_11510 [Proteobacteria bacterium]|nr:hypothetical protein [Pseudomonadota bacterium]